MHDPDAMKLVEPYYVRRVPLRVVFNGEPTASVVHPQDYEAVVADPGTAEVDVSRTELAERGFHAGALAMLMELDRAGLLATRRRTRRRAAR
jgi:hypothetical protein